LYARNLLKIKTDYLFFPTLFNRLSPPDCALSFHVSRIHFSIFIITTSREIHTILYTEILQLTKPNKRYKNMLANNAAGVRIQPTKWRLKK